MGRTGQHESGRPVVRDGILYGADEHVARWVAGRIEGFALSQDARALGIIQQGDIVAGVVYEHFNGFHCQASIAARPGARWATRGVLRAIFALPFIEADCLAVSVAVPTSNLKSLNLATALGFEPEAIIKYAAHDGSALVVLKMFRENCRWIDNGAFQQGRCAEAT